MGSVYGVEAFPLYWPEGWKRTPGYQRERGRYQVGFAQARTELLNELDKLGARDVLISSNIPLRRDGLPYAAVTEPSDTGIAVYWTTGSRESPIHRTIACDKYLSTAANLRALGASIQAFNVLRRAGASQVLEQAFKGFTALPAGRAWYTILEVPPTATMEQVSAAFRRLSAIHHPDVAGGSHETMAALSSAFADAKAHFKELAST